MALRPDVKVALAAGTTAVIAGLGVWAWAASRREAPELKGGSLLCPWHVGKKAAPSATLKPGDFVVVQLQSADGRFHESTWASIVSATNGTLVAILTGEQVPAGVRPLSTDKHGFRLGHRLLLDRDCIWEVFHPQEHTGQILCGPQIVELAEFLEDESLFPIKAGLTVQPGDRARIIVASEESFGNAWFEKLWTRITTITPSGQVITAIVEDDPTIAEHGLGRGSVLRFNRDCIIGV